MVRARWRRGVTAALAPLVFAILFPTQPVVAQDIGTAGTWQSRAAPLGLGLMSRQFNSNASSSPSLPGLWRAGRNAARLRESLSGDSTSQSSAIVSFTSEAGSLRRPQTPARTGNVLAGVAGAHGLGQWFATAGFAYQRRRDRNLQMSSVADPYGPNLFVLADTAGGDWSRDVVDLRLAIASSAERRASVGLGVEYTIGQGARRNDPNPLFRARDIAIAPGLAIGSDRFRVGANARLRWTREDDELGFASSDFPIIYRLSGVTSFQRTPVNSVFRVSTGHSAGGGLQFAGASGPWRWSLGGFADRWSIVVADGDARPTSAGDERRTLVGGTATLRLQSAAWGAEIVAEARHDGMRGNDPLLSVSVTSLVDSDADASLGVAWWPGRQRATAKIELRMLARAGRRSREDLVDPAAWSATGSAIGAGLTVRGTPHWVGGHRVAVALESAFSGSLASDLTVNYPGPLTTRLVEPDHGVNAMPMHWVGAAFSCDAGRQRAGPTLFVSAWYASASGTASKERHGLGMGVRVGTP